MAEKVTLKIGTFMLPVKAVSAAKSEDEDSDLKTVCPGKDAPHAPNKVEQHITCPTCKRDERSYPPYKKGRDNGDGTYTVLTDEQVAEAKGLGRDVTHEMNVTTAPADQVDKLTIPGGKLYWLSPEDGAGDWYPLVREGIRRRTDKAFLVVWAVRSAPGFYRLRVIEDLLALEQMPWPNQVKDRPTVAGEANEAFLPMFDQLVELLSADFDPSTFRDVRKERIAAALATAEAVAGGDGAPSAADAPDTAANPLLRALEAMAASKGVEVPSLTVVKPAKKATKPRKKPAAKKPAVAKSA